MKRLLALALVFMLLFCGCGAPDDGENTNENNENPESEISSDDKLIALSFDDGPCLGATNALLDYFDEMDIVGTFFVIGNNINDETAEVMKRAYEMGCEIGNHSKSHESMGNMIPPKLEEEINYVQELVKSYIGVEPVLFRPPFLNVSQTMHDTIENTFIFGRDSQDWTGIPAEERAQNVLNFAEDGIIVLMHDGWDNWETVEAVKIIVPELLEQGYKFVTISELFEAKGVEPEAHSGVIYSDTHQK